MADNELLNGINAYQTALMKAIESPENWRNLLKVMGNIFGLPIEAQIAISQRDTNARAAMTKEQWEKNGYRCDSGREMNISFPSGEIRQYYLIDDVRPTEKAKPIPVWRVDESDYRNFISYYAQKYHTESFNRFCNESDSTYRSLFMNSLNDIVFQRFGMNNGSRYKYNFNNIPYSTLCQLIYSLNAASRELIGTLKEFSIKNGKCVNYTFDTNNSVSYNQNENVEKEVSADDRSKDVNSDLQQSGTDRSKLNSVDIAGGGTVLRTDIGSLGTEAAISLGNGSSGQIRERAVELSEGERSGTDNRTVSGRAAQGNSVQEISGGTGQRSVRASGTPLQRYNETRGNIGSSKNKLVEICSRKVQRNLSSGGNSQTSNDLQLTLFNTTNETAGLDESDPAVFVYNNVEKVLLGGSNFRNGKFRIYKYFLENFNIKVRANFLINEYGDGGGTFYFTDESRGRYDFSRKGLRLLDDSNNEILLKWSDVSIIIDYLIKGDLYLSPEEKERYKVFLKDLQEESMRSEFISKVIGLMDNDTDTSKNLKDYYRAVCLNKGEFVNKEQTPFYMTNIKENSVNDIIYRFLTFVSASNLESALRARELLDEFSNFAPECFELSIPNEYLKIQNEYPDNIVLMRVGDFYEVIGENASTVASALDITLMSRPLTNGERIDMCGFPSFKLEEYSTRIVSELRDVVVAELNSNNLAEKTYEIVSGEKTVAVSNEVEALTPDEILTQVEDVEIKPEPNILRATDLAEPLIESAPFKTNSHRNFMALCDFAPLVLNDDVSYIRLEAGESFDPLTIEKIGGNQVSVSHHYILNGDLMYDPEIVFLLDKANQELRPLTYQQDNMGIYQTVIRENGTIDRIHEAQLSQFTKTWFSNIKAQGFKIRRVIVQYQNEDIDLYFNPQEQLCRIGSDLAERYCAENNIRLADPDIEVDIEPAVEIAQNAPSVEAIEIVGEKVSLDGRDYVVDSTDLLSGNATLIDVTADGDSKFPMGRVESSSTVVTAILENDSNIVSENVSNYHITDDDIGVGTKSQRFKANIEAIKTLKAIESENRTATEDEQGILAKYVGWGGLADVFDERHTGYAELHSLLNSEEYTAARASTLSAFYTPPVVIRSIYMALENMGFRKGNILEPSCGVGNFFGLLPETMNNSRLYGVELDSISGKIAKQLYPNANIQIKGFEKTTFENDTFDVAIGNVPFGQFSVTDRDYDKNHFLIHDYFFAKALDKVRSGGVVAFITSKGTLDKDNSTVRKYIAQRAELLGAIRLPDNTFKRAAGTEVTSDIIFLQKREIPLDIEPDWVHLNKDDNGISMNSYFVDHPEMVLGEMQTVSTAYGYDSACKSNGQDLEELLKAAIQNIKGKITEQSINKSVVAEKEDAARSIPAIDGIKNMAYAVINNKVYRREGDRMTYEERSATEVERFKGLIAIRIACQDLITLQVEDASDEAISDQQSRLNAIYDEFVEKHGRINDRKNTRLFSSDPSFPLLSSLENFNEDGEFESKSDLFYMRTIRPNRVITQADNANDALYVSLSEKGKVDMKYIQELTGYTVDKIENDLNRVIFKVPSMDTESEAVYVTADEYLSGNVKEKLNFAKMYYNIKKENWVKTNIEALEQVQPDPLKASQISIRMGATWIPSDIIDEFLYKTFNTSVYNRKHIYTTYSDITGEWFINHKEWDSYSVAARSVYGTKRVNGLQLFEDCLNLRNTIVRDPVEEDDKTKYVVNENETKLAQSKQKQIRKEFEEWIWSEPVRRNRLEQIYNDKFNSWVNRKYDGSHLNFDGMNSNVTLRPHQKNAVARILYGNNTLLDHCVGAGKTFVMVAAAMESKRIGLCHKNLITVPNSIVGQFAAEFMTLYPAANILVATENDFKTMNRKKFCSRIATGDYDAVIMGHSQFEKIPISKKTQIETLNRQLEEVVEGIRESKYNNGTVKSLERTRRSLETRLEKLNDIEQDDTITFEELGIDKLFVDEAHNFKNLFLYTKMSNISGINTTESKKATDMYNKVRWLDEQTQSKGTVFATGTPVSNTMAELYTMQRYLQYDRLKQLGLVHFDAWASSFGETVTELELKPEGTGFRLKERFAKFYNVPELMSLYREIADIQTKDTLNLEVPEVNFENIVCQPSDIQRDMVEQLGERADKVRDGVVDPSADNMLLITSDGRKLALDQRLIDPTLPDFEFSKVNRCVDDVYDVWEKTSEERLTQLIFCDLSTPNGKGFNVYADIKQKLIDKGIPENEIAFAHDAKTNAKKEELFKKVRQGKVRVLLGSTQKCGTGANVQDRLIATYDLDCPWRPADLEQRLGRIERQGNSNKDVYVRRYVTEGTFDAYMYQLVEKKQRFISQVKQGDTSIRELDDIDESSLNYAKLKALAVGNPLIQEKMELDLQVRDLLQQKQAHNAEIFHLQDQISFEFPKRISNQKAYIEAIKSDIETIKLYSENAPVIIKGVELTEPKDIGMAINSFKDDPNIKEGFITVGTYKGLDIKLFCDDFRKSINADLGKSVKDIHLGIDATTNGKKVLSSLDKLAENLVTANINLDTLENELANAKEAVKRSFPAQDELAKKQARLEELNDIFEGKSKDNIAQKDIIIQ